MIYEKDMLTYSCGVKRVLYDINFDGFIATKQKF